MRRTEGMEKPLGRGGTDKGNIHVQETEETWKIHVRVGVPQCVG